MQRKHVLLVEQDRTIIDFFQTQLDEKFDLSVFVQGKPAIQLKSPQFILAIVAQNLPDIDGLEVIAQLHRTFPHMLIIFLATTENHEVFIDALKKGAIDFIQKPIRLNEAIARLKKYLLSIEHSPTSRLADFFLKIKFSSQRFKNSSGTKTVNGIQNWLKTTVQSFLFQVTTRGNQTARLPKLKVNNAPGKPDSHASLQQPKYTIHIKLLGKFEVTINERNIENWPGKRTREIMAYLFLNCQKKVLRDVLMDTFWPNSHNESARNCLNVTLHHLRTFLQKYIKDKDLIIYENECYFLNPEFEIRTDIGEFTCHYYLAQRNEQNHNLQTALDEYQLAAEQYQGELLEDFPYENWLELDRESLKNKYLIILNKLSHYYSCNGHPEIAIDLGEKILKIDNCLEDVHRRLMKCYVRINQRDKAARQYYRCIKNLKDELDVAPSRQTIALFEKIKEKYQN
ncbi:response regulator [candidate division KSB1 bacterium]|nr:response regulator [candidate division KSB1 bacterium]